MYKTILCTLLLALGCAPVVKNLPARFPLANEKLYIYPLVNNTALAGAEEWPADSAGRAVLNSYFPRLQQGIMEEMRRSEKFGHYAVVEDSAAATMRLLITLQPAQKRADTLCIGLALQVRPRAGKSKFTDTLSSCGIYKPTASAEKPLYYWGYILADYVRSFPYERLSGLFYAHKVP